MKAKGDSPQKARGQLEWHVYSPGGVGRDSQHLPLLTTRGKLLLSHSGFGLPITNTLLLPWCVAGLAKQSQKQDLTSQ